MHRRRSTLALLLALSAGFAILNGLGAPRDQGPVPVLPLGDGDDALTATRKPTGEDVKLLAPESDPTIPRPRAFHDMAYDAESDRLILFGGRGALSQPLGETWAYDFDANTWTEMSPVEEPSPRFGHAMVYVLGVDRILLFGGWLGSVHSNETWAYDYDSDTWTELSPGTSPSPRAGHEIAYDAGSNQVVVLGGNVAGMLNDETWVYSLTAGTWTQMNPTIKPSPRERHRMVYVPSEDRVVLFGGSRPAVSDQTWAYDFKTDSWEQKNPTTSPSARHGHGMAYDSGSDRVILFSGVDGAGNDETWAYDLATDTWTEANPPVAPGRRVGHGLEYDSHSDRTILFGGEWPFLSGSSNNETWAYDYESDTWSPLTPPSAPRSLEASPGDGVVDLTWLAPSYDYGAPVSGYRIYRGTVSGDLAFLTEVGSVLSYEDANVTFGIAYFYQVRAISAAGESPPSSEASASPADATSPTIDITSPQEGETLSSASTEVRGTASDNVAVMKVELSTDEATWVLAEGTANWSGSLTLEVGSNTIYARASDAAGNEATESISLTYTPPGIDPVVLGVATGAVGAAAIAGALLLRRRRRK